MPALPGILVGTDGDRFIAMGGRRTPGREDTYPKEVWLSDSAGEQWGVNWYLDWDSLNDPDEIEVIVDLAVGDHGVLAIGESDYDRALIWYSPDGHAFRNAVLWDEGLDHRAVTPTLDGFADLSRLGEGDEVVRGFDATYLEALMGLSSSSMSQPVPDVLGLGDDLIGRNALLIEQAATGFDGTVTLVVQGDSATGIEMAAMGSAGGPWERIDTSAINQLPGIQEITDIVGLAGGGFIAVGSTSGLGDRDAAVFLLGASDISAAYEPAFKFDSGWTATDVGGVVISEIGFGREGFIELAHLRGSGRIYFTALEIGLVGFESSRVYLDPAERVRVQYQQGQPIPAGVKGVIEWRDQEGAFFPNSRRRSCTPRAKRPSGRRQPAWSQ